MGQQLFIGVNAAFDRLHTIVFREEANGSVALVGEDRTRNIAQFGDQQQQIRRIWDSIVAALDDARVAPSDILTVGIANLGQIDQNNETVVYATNLGVRNFPVAARLREYIDVPIKLFYVMDAYAVGEQRFGAGRPYSDMVYIYISQGIGASLFFDRKLYRGKHNLAGEFGHATIDYQGRICDCGNIGCIEDIASRKAITASIQRAYKQGKQTLLADMFDLSAESLDISISLLAEAIAQKDALAIAVIEEAAEAFGAAMANLINILNPEAIIVGGEMVDDIELFFQRSIASAQKRALAANFNSVTILQGALGTTAGAYGAALLAKQFLPAQERNS